MTRKTYYPNGAPNTNQVPDLPDPASLPEGVTAHLVQVIQYETVDKLKFYDVPSAEHHSKVLSGKRRVCLACRGTGVNNGPDGRDHWKCSPCAGRGWQEHTTTWS